MRIRGLFVMAGSAMLIAMAALPASAHQPGRMTGGGSVFTASGMRVTHGFQIHCIAPEGAAAIEPNNLQVNWGKGLGRFHLTQLTRGECSNSPLIDSGQPPAPFEVYRGAGWGRYNGVDGAFIDFRFTDAGEPGTEDTMWVVVKDAAGKTVLRVWTQATAPKLDRGNHQAHTSTGSKV